MPENKPIHQPTPAVHNATLDLVRAAATFMGAAADQLGAHRPNDLAALNAAVADGHASMVVVIGMSEDGYCAQLCADVGTSRQILASVPVALPVGLKH